MNETPDIFFSLARILESILENSGVTIRHVGTIPKVRHCAEIRELLRFECNGKSTKQSHIKFIQLRKSLSMRRIASCRRNDDMFWCVPFPNRRQRR